MIEPEFGVPNINPAYENDGSMPAREVYMSLGPQAYELDGIMEVSSEYEQHYMNERAAEVITKVAMSGDDEDVWRLAGLDRAQANAKTMITPEMTVPRSYGRTMLKYMGPMTPGERLALQAQAELYAKSKMDLE